MKDIEEYLIKKYGFKKDDGLTLYYNDEESNSLYKLNLFWYDGFWLSIRDENGEGETYFITELEDFDTLMRMLQFKLPIVE